MSQDKETAVFAKYEKLKHIVRSYKSVGVAFSGGVDSSLLLLAAGESLGKEKVIAYHGRSVLSSYETDIEDFFASRFKEHAQLKIIDLQPLTWPEFISNDSGRCYYCKKRTYLHFYEELKKDSHHVLIDGTNRDDLNEERPGLAVINELAVKTPLVEAGLSKKEIRFLARAFHLSNHDQPANSCLATRIRFAQDISHEGLEQVSILEESLKEMGFSGCRARPDGKKVIIEIRDQDYQNFIKKNKRIDVSDLAGRLGFTKVLLDIKGRK